MNPSTDGRLEAPYLLEYVYKRSVGPVVGRFLGALLEARIDGVRTPDGRVIVPPVEYDPASGESLGARDEDWVTVGPGGVVTTWAWVAEPRPTHPLQRPFAYALVRLDGADTAMLHAVDAGSPERMKTGMRVVPRWKAERSGSILDIECFIPEETA
jgi:uncharacterized OB-fold protein